MTKFQYNRKKIGLSQFELAKYSDVSIKTIQSYEQNKRSIDSCRLDNLLKISCALNVSLLDLIEDDDLRKRVIFQVYAPDASEH